MHKHVTKSHSASLDKYPKVLAGDYVTFYKIEKSAPAWFRGRTTDDIEGYFPVEDFDINESASLAVCVRNYDATELTVFAGDIVEPLASYGGWMQVHHRGDIGWIPADCCDELYSIPASA